MDSKLQNKLVEDYKEFFEYLREYKGPLMPITFGFECSDGWYVILDELMSNIQHHIKNENRNRKNRLRSPFAKWLDRKRYRLPWKMKRLKNFIFWVVDKFPRGVDPMPPINVTQIKEKFGGLCFYYDGGDDYIYGLVSFAESMSYRTCEICGSTKNVGMTQGWLRAVCKSCFETDEWCQGKKWRPGPRNIMNDVEKFLDDVIDDQKKKDD